MMDSAGASGWIITEEKERKGNFSNFLDKVPSTEINATTIDDVAMQLRDKEFDDAESPLRRH